ncbi:hypothetical protein EHS13_30430 [Paenibacillus psychroresistens]|uniref:DUF1461 domain-containing protein n=1 Tax=Paenibacillus psychroresistens TaxID=1778678 RepID=A0A6B8RSI1_9BACL|nr:hypothetical protein [Paenibacillus psychroresistens]QGQ98889.1 hypothetical protein EHS13_30430 [Paenibacillus psychroresistens]
MKIVSYLLLTIFTALLIILIPIATVLFSANTTFLKPYNTEKYLADSGIYGYFEQKLRNNFVNEDVKVKQTALEKLQDKLVGQAFDAIVTDELVSNKMSLVQTGLWDYFTDKTDTVLGIPIAEVSTITEKFPTLKIGDHADINTMIGLKTDKMEKYKTYYSLYSKGIWGLYALIFILVGICALLTYVLNITGKWLGASIVIGGAIALFLWVPTIIASEMVSDTSASDSLRNGMFGLFKSARHDFLQCLTIISVVVIALGIVTTFMRKRLREEEAPQENNDVITIL